MCQCLELLGMGTKLRKTAMRHHLKLNGVEKYNWPKI